MPIEQKYNINTGAAYEGMVYGLRTAMVIRTVEAAHTEAAKQPKAGRAVKAAADTVRGVEGVNAANGAADTCYGIIVRQINHEAAARPSLDGEMVINKGDLLGMVVEGEVMVKLQKAVKRDVLLGSHSDGTWTDANPYANVVALQAGAAGDIVPARIFQMTAKPVVAK